MSRLKQVIHEVHRRSLWQVLGIYLVGSWVALQVVDVLAANFNLPDWFPALALGLLVVGLPIVLATAFVQEGVGRSDAADRSPADVETTIGGTPIEPFYPRDSGAPHRLFTWRNAILGGTAAFALWGVIAAAWLVSVGRRDLASARAGLGTREAIASIAVLPFVDMSQAQDQEYFADGISEELLTVLSRIPELRVIGRTSSFQFKGKNEDLRTIGEKLGVANVLEGSVRQSADRLRITAQLIRTDDGSHLWSEEYDRQADDIFRIQDEIAAAVGEQLKVTLLGEQLTERPTPASTEAYNLYLQGRFFMERRSAENLKKAVDYLRQSIDLDPNYAPAWVAISSTYTNQALAGILPADSGRALQRSALDRALELDPELAEAHSSNGFALAFSDWDWKAADAAFQRSLALEPGNAAALSSASLLYVALGRREEAVELSRQATLRDPLRSAARHNLGFVSYVAGKLDEAETAFRQALELSPHATYTRYWLSRVLLAQGKPEAALEEIQGQEIDAWRVAGLSVIYWALGRTEEADAALAELTERFASTNAVAIAEAHAYRGEIDAAFEWLERAYTQHDPLLPWVQGNPLLRDLEGDPRHAAFLEKMGLAD